MPDNVMGAASGGRIFQFGKKGDRNELSKQEHILRFEVVLDQFFRRRKRGNKFIFWVMKTEEVCSRRGTLRVA
jgi:hypothetical protein